MLGVGDGGELRRGTVEEEFALVAAMRMQAGEELDQGGLARAVLAAQRVDLARAQVKAHLAQRGDAGEALRDGTGFEQGGHYF